MYLFIDMHVYVFAYIGKLNGMKEQTSRHQWPLLLTWINFNPSMDK